MDKRFTVTTLPNVQENLKLTVKEHVILEEPASSTGTLSSLQHLANNFSFGDLFFNDKPSEVENEKIIAETEAESMVSRGGSTCNDPEAPGYLEVPDRPAGGRGGAKSVRSSSM
nr:hypothetical protein [Tanacetum cinerariifolium]